MPHHTATDIGEELAVAASPSRGRRVLANRRVRWGLVILGLMVVVAAFADFLAPHDPTQIFRGAQLQPPSREHWFGTDGYAMDVFSRVVHAARLNLGVAIAGVAAGMAVGVGLGLLTGYLPGAPDTLVMRSLDVLQSFPTLILAIAIVAVMEAELWSVIFVIALFDIPIFARLTRQQTLAIRETMYIEAARSAGIRLDRLILFQLLPNAMPPLIVQTSVRLAWAVKTTASLAFVGVGIQVPTPEWGSMIRVGAEDMVRGFWWTSLFPGVAIVLLSLAFNLMADGIQEEYAK